jgi:uncharacterized protein YgfB (UPF0149 family)
MTLLKDLFVLKNTKRVEEEKLEFTDVKGQGAEVGLARKHMAAAIKKGYPKQGAINYTVSHLKGQGWSVGHCSKVAEDAWKELSDEPLKEGYANPSDIAEDLQEMLEQMRECMDNVKRLLRNAPGDIQQHANHYWVAHIITALGSDHEYAGGTSKYDTMEATITKLREESEGE